MLQTRRSLSLRLNKSVRVMFAGCALYGARPACYHSDSSHGVFEMTKKNLVYSLIFPAITVIGGLLYAAFWGFLPSVVIICSGLLAIFLTVGLRIDTSRYFKIRIIFFGLSLVTFVIPVLLFNWFAGDGPRAAFSYFLLNFFIFAPFAAFLAEIVCLIRLRAAKNPGAFVVMILSDALACDLVALACAFLSLCITGI